MFGKLFLIFTSVSLLEIFVLVKVGSFLGAGPTIALVVISALIGSALVRSQGLQLISDVQARMAKGEMPGQQLIEGMMLIVTGVLLVTPGFVTDFLGLLLLQPNIRRQFAQTVLAKMSVNQMGGFSSGANGFYAGGSSSPFNKSANDENVMEGEFERKDDKRIDKK